MDVRVWLEGLGLGQYADTFETNHIDGSVLRGLTPDDLREIGVASLGHRKRLLEAIALVAAREPEQERATEAERRQVAVLFADLCGFTELSAATDPEEIRNIVEQFLARADEIVSEHGGTVDKHIGDATMALFGAPIAHEDDAWRAVAAACALQRAMPTLSAKLDKPLQTHIGIALGEVVAGEVGGAIRRDYTVLGETVNLAARLVGSAAAGEIVLSVAAYRAVAERIRAVDLGVHSLKGITRPKRFWRVEALRGDDSQPGARLPFVGREIELAQVRAVIAAASPGAVIHLRGEAGIGKSRLLVEATAEAERQGFAIVRLYNFDFGAADRSAPSRMLADWLIARCPSWIDDPAVDGASRATMLDVLGRSMPAELAIPYAAMQDSKRAALRAESVAALACAVAAREPIAVSIEDLHWASDATKRLTRALARMTRQSRLVLLTTARPEGDPVDAAFRRDLDHASIIAVELGPLRADATERLARMAASALHESVLGRLVTRSGGNPLFLEQLALNAAEADTGPLPGSIRGLVQSRLDRLARSDRAALQAAAVLGQRFSQAALEVIIGQRGYDPRPLIDAVLLVRDGGMLMFAHALIQEATYASLLGETARRLHRRAADWFGENEPDLRAEHLDRAGDPGAPAAYLRASELLQAGGRVALALDRAERGLALAGTDADIIALALRAGHMHIELGSPAQALIRFREALARSTSDSDRGEAEYGIAAAMRITDDLTGAGEALDRAQELASRADLTTLGSRCHHLRGNLLFPQGQVDACMDEHRAALALAERAQSPELVARALGGLADAFYAQGRMRSSAEVLERCITAARAAGAGAVEIANRPMAAFVECFSLRLDRMREMSEVARSLAIQAQNRRAELIALHGLMIAAIDGATPELGLPHVPTARRIVAELGAWRFEGENVIFGACLEAAAGRLDVAASMARDAVALSREHARTYLAPLALGMGAFLIDDAAERDSWLAEGEELLAAPSLWHNHYFFRRYAIDTCLKVGRTDEARKHAAALEQYAAREPLPLTELVVRRGNLLADLHDGKLSPEGRAKLHELANLAVRSGFISLAERPVALLKAVS